MVLHKPNAVFNANGIDVKIELSVQKTPKTIRPQPCNNLITLPKYDFEIQPGPTAAQYAFKRVHVIFQQVCLSIRSGR